MKFMLLENKIYIPEYIVVFLYLTDNDCRIYPTLTILNTHMQNCRV